MNRKRKTATFRKQAPSSQLANRCNDAGEGELCPLRDFYKLRFRDSGTRQPAIKVAEEFSEAIRTFEFFESRNRGTKTSSPEFGCIATDPMSSRHINRYRSALNFNRDLVVVEFGELRITLQMRLNFIVAFRLIEKLLRTPVLTSAKNHFGEVHSTAKMANLCIEAGILFLLSPVNLNEKKGFSQAVWMGVARTESEPAVNLFFETFNEYI